MNLEFGTSLDIAFQTDFNSLRQHVNLQRGVDRQVAVLSRWGQRVSKHAQWVACHAATVPMNSGFDGQVGQESNLQPAVLEHSAHCPESSNVV